MAADPRREKLETLRQREQMKDLLVQKYKDRYGCRHAGSDVASLASETIRREVDRLVGGAAPVTQANLSRLERRLERLQQGGRVVAQRAPDAASSAISVSSYTVGTSVPSGQGSSHRGSLSARGSANGRAARQNVPLTARAPQQPGLEWSVLDQLSAVMHRQDVERQRSREKELQERLRRDLDQQLRDAALLKEREKEAERRYHELTVASDRELEQKELEKEAARRQRVTAQRESVTQHIEKVRQRRMEEKAREAAEAQELMASIRREAELDRLRSEQRLQVQKQQAQEALKAGSDAHRQREEFLRQQAATEERSVEEYQQLLSQRDRRVKESQAREQQHRQQLEDVAAERVRAKRSEEDAQLAKAAKELAEKDCREAEREQKHHERRANERLQTQAFLCEQIRERRSEKDRHLEELRQYREAQEREAEQRAALERSREVQRKQRLFEHRAELERQIVQRAAPRPLDKEAMSDCELRLNRQLLEKVTEALATIPVK